MIKLTIQSTITVDVDHPVCPETLTDLKCECQSAILAQVIMLLQKRASLIPSSVENYVAILEES